MVIRWGGKRTFNKRCLKRKKKEKQTAARRRRRRLLRIFRLFSLRIGQGMCPVSLSRFPLVIASTVNYRNAGPSHTKPSFLSLGILPFRDLLSFFLSSSFLFSFANYRRREFEQEIKKKKKKVVTEWPHRASAPWRQLSLVFFHLCIFTKLVI